MLTTNTGVRSPTPLDYLACYSLYALLLVCSVVTLLIWRVTILLLIATWIGVSSVNASIYAVSLIVIWLGLFMLVIAAEPYLRNGVKRGQLMHRVCARSPARRRRWSAGGVVGHVDVM